MSFPAASDDKPMKAIALPERYWQKISHALADVLCWHAGFNAGRTDSDASDPCDLHTLRSLNSRIKDMLS